MKLQLPYSYETLDTDGKKGSLAFPPYVISKSKFDSTLEDSIIEQHLTATLNKFGNCVYDMHVSRDNESMTVTCYSNYSKYHQHQKWTIKMEDADKHPIMWY